jgi:hypothetical protein
MRTTRPIGVIVGVGLLLGVAAVAVADDWSDLYLSQPRDYSQAFSNRAAWSGRVVRLGPDWFGVQRYEERVRIHVLEGEAWVQEGRPVRVYPLGHEGYDEIAELRIPDLNFRPVALVRYDARELPRERLIGFYEERRYGLGPIRPQGQGSDWRPVGPPEYRPSTYNRPPTYRPSNRAYTPIYPR